MLDIAQTGGAELKTWNKRVVGNPVLLTHQHGCHALGLKYFFLRNTKFQSSFISFTHTKILKFLYEKINNTCTFEQSDAD